jgi:hypothetical protein
MGLFLKEKSGLIKNVYEELSGGSVIYYIRLKDDSYSIKDEFLECLNVFDDFGFDDKIKVLIRFIPSDYAGQITFKNEVVFK